MDALSGMPPPPTASADTGMPAGALLPGMMAGLAGGGPGLGPPPDAAAMMGDGLAPPGPGGPPGMPPMPMGPDAGGGAPPQPGGMAPEGGGVTPMTGPDGGQGVYVPQDLFYKLVGDMLQQMPPAGPMGMEGGPAGPPSPPPSAPPKPSKPSKK